MVTAEQRVEHRRWLKTLTGIPTAAACEDRVIAWVTDWVRERRNLRLRTDPAGNLIITRQPASKSGRPVYITAHLDHPAFVVRRMLDENNVALEFRGGVHDPYFDKALIEIVDHDGTTHRGTLTSLDSTTRPFKRVTCRLRRPAKVSRGAIGRWVFRGRGQRPTIVNGRLYAPACDDLAGVAAALAALDVLRKTRGVGRFGVLLTRAEEIGFVGAIAACKHRSLPKNAWVICLENSRSFPESPIGAGPILRVGDRLSVFSPELTNRLSFLMREYCELNPGFKAQRKLMPGGVCEASTFSAYGYQSSCVCLPMGNYHNMVDIDGVLAGRRPARVGAEHVSVTDYDGMVRLLVHFARRLDAGRVPDIAMDMDNRYLRHGKLIEK